MLDVFLLGVIAASSLMAALFFLKFWRHTRDFLFLAFAIAFIVESFTRGAVLLTPRPNEGSPWIYLLRLFAALLILGAILRKNFGGARSSRARSADATNS